MTTPGIGAVYLENTAGERVTFQGTCSLGRAPSNTVVLNDTRVSRRHAIIHAQGGDEYWLVDFGSSNGTFVNGRRVTQPMPLKDKEEIQIAHVRFIFRQTTDAEAAEELGVTSQQTLREPRTAPCWLLVADILNSTVLTRTLPPDQVPVVFGGWFARCRQLVMEQEGVIDKFLGDGLFAYWPEQEGTAERIARTVEQLKVLQGQAQPAFRFVIHHGLISLGGAADTGDGSLLGQEVHFVFRMEKLAGALKQDRLLSESVADRLKPHLPARPVGRYPLSGFEGEFPFFTC